MSPKNGYLLKSSNEGELYPFTIARSSDPIDEESIIASTTPESVRMFQSGLLTIVFKFYVNRC